MSQLVECTWRGLCVEATIEDYNPGTHFIPPSGGCVEEYWWGVEDIDEVIEELDLDSKGAEKLIRLFYTLLGRLPTGIVKKIDREWDFFDHLGDFWWADRK